MLKSWFGVITQDIVGELADLDALLENFDGNREQLLKKALEKGSKIEKGLRIEQKIRDELNEAIRGTKQVNTSDLMILAQLHRDFGKEKMWLELKDLWHKELDLVQKGRTSELPPIIERQKRIAKIIKQLTELEYNETHMHFGMSVDPSAHFEYMMNLYRDHPDETEATWKEYLKSGKLRKKDYDKLRRLCKAYTEGKISRVHAFMSFERMIFMREEQKGSFLEFVLNTQILNAIVGAVTRVGPKFLLKFLEDQFFNIAAYNLQHNVKHIEIRFPALDYGLLDIAKILQNTENKVPVSMRFIQIFFSQISLKELDKFAKEYEALPSWANKYYVAVDLLGNTNTESLKDISKHSPLPLCVHAGEFYNTQNTGQPTLVQAIAYSLNQVKNCVEAPNIARIGHANVLGLDIHEYLESESKMPIDQVRGYADALTHQQQSLLREIKRKGIIIEVNPTCNLYIQDMKGYEEHPVRVFETHGVKFAISTDDRIIFDTNLKKEFYRIADALNWEQNQIEKAARMQKEAKL